MYDCSNFNSIHYSTVYSILFTIFYDFLIHYDGVGGCMKLTPIISISGSDSSSNMQMSWMSFRWCNPVIFRVFRFLKRNAYICHFRFGINTAYLCVFVHACVYSTYLFLLIGNMQEICHCTVILSRLHTCYYLIWQRSVHNSAPSTSIIIILGINQVAFDTILRKTFCKHMVNFTLFSCTILPHTSFCIVVDIWNHNPVLQRGEK